MQVVLYMKVVQNQLQTKILIEVIPMWLHAPLEVPTSSAMNEIGYILQDCATIPRVS